MSVGRVLAGIAASAAVAGSAVAVIAMAQARPGEGTAQRTTAVPTQPPTSRPAHPVSATAPDLPTSVPASTVPAASSPARTTRAPARVVLPTHAPTATGPVVRNPPVPAALTTSAAAPKPQPTTRATPKPAPKPTPKPAPRPAGQRLPLGYSTGNATRVITVVAGSSSSTTATLQAWNRTGSGWSKWGPAITAWVGADGIGRSSEYRSTTPAGSHTLTQAFGYYSNPGTGLPYFKTTWADWWISTAGSQYNTHQRCSSCGYRSPDEHLVTETPYYNYAVVIDTPSGASAYPGGSAFFLHVHPSGTGPTAGCVAIPQANLVTIMRWLAPWAHPRILIGVA